MFKKFDKWFNENINKFEFVFFSFYYIIWTIGIATQIDDSLPRTYYDPITIWDTILLPLLGVGFPVWLGFNMAKKHG